MIFIYELISNQPPILLLSSPTPVTPFPFSPWLVVHRPEIFSDKVTNRTEIESPSANQEEICDNFNTEPHFCFYHHHNNCTHPIGF